MRSGRSERPGHVQVAGRAGDGGIVNKGRGRGWWRGGQKGVLGPRCDGMKLCFFQPEFEPLSAQPQLDHSLCQESWLRSRLRIRGWAKHPANRGAED